MLGRCWKLVKVKVEPHMTERSPALSNLTFVTVSKHSELVKGCLRIIQNSKFALDQPLKTCV